MLTDDKEVEQRMKTKVEIIDEVEGKEKKHFRYKITRDSGEPADRGQTDAVQVTVPMRDRHAHASLLARDGPCVPDPI